MHCFCFATQSQRSILQFDGDEAVHLEDPINNVLLVGEENFMPLAAAEIVYFDLDEDDSMSVSESSSGDDEIEEDFGEHNK